MLLDYPPSAGRVDKPRLMHGSDWSGHNVAGWWISEKLDGWRLYWSGAEFITRHGTVLDAPGWFRTGIPSQLLDGELWAGAGTTHDAVASAVGSGDWTRLSFRPFDIPALGVKPEAAMVILASLPLPSHVRPIEYHRAESTQSAIAEMHATVAGGGEGAMLRKPGSGYSPDYRTRHLLKMTPATVAKWQSFFAVPYDPKD
jgi:DNA ligase 1